MRPTPPSHSSFFLPYSLAVVPKLLPHSMFVFTLPKLHKHLHSSNSLSSYLTKHIDSFLTTDYLDQKTLVSAHAAIITTGNAHNKFIASKLVAYYASLKQSHNSTKLFDSLTFTHHFLWNSIIKAHFSCASH